MKRCGIERIGTVTLWALVTIAPPVHAGRPKKGPQQAPQRIVHTPAREQAILTPIPIWVESRDASVVRVVAYYQVFGSK